MAPEVVKFHNNMNQSKNGYDGMKADIWSLGFVLFRMLGEIFPKPGPFKESLPFSSTNIQPLFQPLRDIYFKCTQQDPMKRPSLDKLLSWIH